MFVDMLHSSNEFGHQNVARQQHVRLRFHMVVQFFGIASANRVDELREGHVVA